jgi:hypothetical protein
MSPAGASVSGGASSLLRRSNYSRSGPHQDLSAGPRYPVDRCQMAPQAAALRPEGPENRFCPSRRPLFHRRGWSLKAATEAKGDWSIPLVEMPLWPEQHGGQRSLAGGQHPCAKAGAASAKKRKRQLQALQATAGKPGRRDRRLAGPRGLSIEVISTYSVSCFCFAPSPLATPEGSPAWSCARQSPLRVRGRGRLPDPTR